MKTLARQARHARVRSRISGTAGRPRLVVFRGSKTLSAQLVDDTAGKTLLTVTTAGKKPATKAGHPTVSVETAGKLGEELAKKASTRKISTVVFDRAGYQYHGVVKAVADGARQGGLKL